MRRDLVWAAVDAQRLRVADLLDTLTDDEWRRPSLCPGWTVKDVAAHLTLQQLTWVDVVPAMIRYRGDTDRAIRELARGRAAASTTGQLAARLRETAGQHRHNAGVTCRETLIDILVHGHDIAVPLGRSLETPPAAAAEATTRMLTTRFPPPFPAARAMKTFRLSATDVAWSAGAGPAVNGPITAIMLVSAGRLTALPQLTGPGTADLTARLGSPAPADPATP